MSLKNKFQIARETGKVLRNLNNLTQEEINYIADISVTLLESLKRLKETIGEQSFASISLTYKVETLRKLRGKQLLKHLKQQEN